MSTIKLCKACRNNLHPVYEKLFVEQKTRDDLLRTISNLEKEGKRLITKCKKLAKAKKELEKQLENERNLIKSLTKSMMEIVSEKKMLKRENVSLKE